MQLPYHKVHLQISMLEANLVRKCHGAMVLYTCNASASCLDCKRLDTQFWIGFERAADHGCPHLGMGWHSCKHRLVRRPRARGPQEGHAQAGIILILITIRGILGSCVRAHRRSQGCCTAQGDIVRGWLRIAQALPLLLCPSACSY